MDRVKHISDQRVKIITDVCRNICRNICLTVKNGRCRDEELKQRL